MFDVTGENPRWRRAAAFESVGLTPLGFAAYQSLAAEAPAAENATAEAEPQPREGTKQATLITMLRRPEGADLDKIAEATAW